LAVSQKQTLEKAKAAAYTQAEADAARDVLKNHPTVHPEIVEPEDQSIHAGPVQVTVRAQGANEAYFNHPVIASPARLRILLNDRELDTSGRWTPDGGGTMAYTFDVIPPVNDNPPQKTPWAEEIWTYYGWGDILHRGYAQAIGAAGINTISVVCMDSPSPPETISFALPMPKRCDLLNYGRETGDTWLFSVQGGILTPADSNVIAGGPWSAVVAGRFTADARTCVAFYNAATGMLRWTLMNEEGVLTVVGEKYVGGSWTHLVAGHFTGRDLDDLLLYRSDMGAGLLWLPDPLGGEGTMLDQPTIPNGWDLIISVALTGNRDRILTYRRGDGYSQIRAVDERGVFQLDGNALSIGAGWTGMVTGNFGGPNGHDLLCVNDDARTTQTWEFDLLGSIVALGHATSPSGGSGPTLAAAGDFGHTGAPDTLWLWNTKERVGAFVRRDPSTGDYGLVPGATMARLPDTFTDALTGRFV
jgi:hypothetical protein